MGQFPIRKRAVFTKHVAKTRRGHKHRGFLHYINVAENRFGANGLGRNFNAFYYHCRAFCRVTVHRRGCSRNRAFNSQFMPNELT
jgi:hypothetical protein